jgi:hypothetical protein
MTRWREEGRGGTRRGVEEEEEEEVKSEEGRRGWLVVQMGEAAFGGRRMGKKHTREKIIIL